MPLLVPYAISIQLPQRLVFGVRYTEMAVTLSPAGSLNADIFIKSPHQFYSSTGISLSVAML
jgi:hypothetical protein